MIRELLYPQAQKGYTFVQKGNVTMANCGRRCVISPNDNIASARREGHRNTNLLHRSNVAINHCILLHIVRCTKWMQERLFDSSFSRFQR